ncbi:MAG: GNAT family protein [Candidatus Riflebacteria bacterium]
MYLEKPIATERLIISEHVESDLIAMHELFSDDVAMHFLDNLKTETIEETRKNLQAAIGEIKKEPRKKYYFKIENTNKIYIGEIGFTVRIDCPIGKVVDFGYFIKQDYWNNGITFEAARALIKYGFENLGIVKIETGCIKENSGSEKIMKKLGMKQESCKKWHVFHDDQLMDRVEYALFRDDYFQQHPNGYGERTNDS